MRITAVELRRLLIPLVVPFRSALGETKGREVLLVRVETSDGEGWGECAALAEPTYTAEYVDGAAHVLSAHLVPRLVAAAHSQPTFSADDVSPALAFVRGHQMAKAALEMAVLDAELRSADKSLADRLGATRTSVEAGVVVGASTIGPLLDDVAVAIDEGYRRVKLKIFPGWDVEPVRAVRERFGDSIDLQADANGAYGLADASHLAQLDSFDLAMIEQPLPAEDLVGSAELVRCLRTPICLDEAIFSADAAAAAIALGAASIVNVKPGRVGGYLEARRVHNLCEAAGIPVWCGGMFETGLARSANLALAALPGFTLAGDICPPSRYLAGDIVAPLRSDQGRLAVPRQAGTGADVQPDALAEFTISTDTIPI